MIEKVEKRTKLGKVLWLIIRLKLSILNFSNFVDIKNVHFLKIGLILNQREKNNQSFYLCLWEMTSAVQCLFLCLLDNPKTWQKARTSTIGRYGITISHKLIKLLLLTWLRWCSLSQNPNTVCMSSGSDAINLKLVIRRGGADQDKIRDSHVK